MLKRPQTPCYVSYAIHIVPGGHEGVCAEDDLWNVLCDMVFIVQLSCELHAMVA